MRRLLLAVLILALLAPASWPAVAQTGYLETFDQYAVDTPFAVAPPAAQVPGLDVVVHSRDRNTWDELEGMTVGHATNCDPPPATHDHYPTQAYQDVAFLCRDHLMTAMNASGYGLVYLTPNQQVDFSAGEAVISLDVSTLRTSARDWWDLWITPYDDNLVAPFDVGDVDLQGGPRRALQVQMGTVSDLTTFRTRRWVNHEAIDLGSRWWRNYETPLVQAGFTTSASRRDTFELRLSSTHVTFRMLHPTTKAPLQTWIDVDIAPLDWTRGIVQIGHHSYNPTKDCAPPCGANTWHWDNLSINPSVPYTQIRANERAVTAEVNVPMLFTFPQPAPAAAHLRVEAIGEGYQVSTDGGTAWHGLTWQTQLLDNQYHHGSYWHPVAAGTQSVLLKSTINVAAVQPQVDYAAIWADAVQQQPPTDTPTPTPVPPTNTPTPTPPATNTPVPQTAIRINTGGAAYTDGQGNAWATDCCHAGSSGTWPPSNPPAIAGTTDDPLYQNQRYVASGGTMTYAITVPNGPYTVRLLFAELDSNVGIGGRVFDVRAEGATVLDDLDVRSAVGYATAYDRSFPVVVSDGQLTLAFVSGVASAIVNAIEVMSETPPTPTPTNTATPTATATNTATPTPTPIPSQCRHPYERSTDGGVTWATLYEVWPCP